MVRFGDGLAVDPDLVVAAECAVAQALAPLEGRRPDLLCVFVAGNEPAAVERAGARAMEMSGAGMTLGCSAEGVIGGSRGVELVESVSAWAAVLPGVLLTPFRLESATGSGHVAEHDVPEMPNINGDAVAVLLADPMTFPAHAFIERSNRVTGGTPIVGGLASSLDQETVRLFLQGRVVRSGAVGVSLGGDVSVRTVVSQGCRPVGPPMTVTSAEGDLVHELAGRPALDKLEEVVTGLSEADRALVDPSLLLGLAIDEYADRQECGDFLVRNVVGADNERGSILVRQGVETGRTVRLQVRDTDTAKKDLDSLLTRLWADPEFESTEGALIFSCNGRGRILFPTADHDATAVRRALGVAGVAGFFAQSEFGPVAGRNHLHGLTASLLAFGPQR